MRSKAIVIGCSGQDGSYLIKYLLSRDYEVVGTSRSKKKIYQNHNDLCINGKFFIKVVDPTNLNELKELISQENACEIYNFSAQSSVGYSFANPIETQQSISLATISILEACKQLNFKGNIFFAGSSEIYGETQHPATVHSKISPKSPYAISKVESFFLVKLYREIYNLNAVTGILFPHESPLRNNKFITQKIISGAIKCSKDKNHKISIGNIEVERDWGWAEEYVEGIYLMTNSQKIQDQIICTGESTKLSDFINITFKKMNLNWKDHIIFDRSLMRGKDIRKSVGNPMQMNKDINWKADLKIEGIIEKLIEKKLINLEAFNNI